MAYQLRFESNAFEADSMIGKALDRLMGLSRNVQRFAGAKVRADEVNKLMNLRGISQRTFERVMDWADADFDQQMVDVQWDWPNTTRRKNGELAGTKRDIIDTGDLLQSKRRDFIAPGISEFIWEDDVAEGVHDGMVTKRGKRLPARPWTQRTLDEIDLVIAATMRQEAR